MYPRSVDRRFRLARIWSNAQLRAIAPLFDGCVINVSAGDDLDKEGKRYEEYFVNSSGYSISNFQPGSFRGFQGRANELLIDLCEEIPVHLRASYDVAFNHTTLEHVFDFRTAFRNICALSKDIVILVVPFSQVQHASAAFDDYWRFAPAGIRQLFQNEGFRVVYEAANDHRNSAVYLFFVGARNVEKWRDRMPAWSPITSAGAQIGRESSLSWSSRFSALLRAVLTAAGALKGTPPWYGTGSTSCTRSGSAVNCGKWSDE